MKCFCHFSGRFNAMEIGIFGVVQDFFNETLFSECSIFCGMQGNVLNGFVSEY